MPQQGPRFTFAAGNARKVLAAPLYLAGAIATRVIRRDQRLWVFGSGSGVGEGALALLEYAAGRGHEPIWLTGSASEDAAAETLGIRHARKTSARGFRLTLRAGVIIVTHGFGDVNRFAARGAFVVQLWHGIPLKRIQLDSPVTFASRIPRLGAILRNAYRRSASAISLLPAASEVSARRLRSAFGLPAQRVLVTGDPRDDVVITRTRAEAREALAAVIGALPNEVILYAPTWRDGEPDPAVPTDHEWAELEAWLSRRDAVLVVRPHPHSVGDYRAGERVRLLTSREVRDITPLLPAVDVLVTDYSSIAYDFALLDRPIAYLAPDVAGYTRTRGLYEPYRQFSGGTEVETWGALLALLDDPTRVAELRSHATRIAEQHHAFRDGANTARVYEAIITRREGASMSLHTAASVPAASPSVTASIEDDATLRVSAPAGDAVPAMAILRGSRVELSAPVIVTDGRWSASVPLTSARWGGEALPAPSGRYELELLDADGAVLRTTLEPVARLLPGRLRVEVDGAVVTVSAPLNDDERGTANQARLEAEYRSRPAQPADAVFFESFYGQNSSCNPRAIDAELARLHPAITRYWSVVDASVSVPEGAVAIIEGSTEWWRARGEARLLVVNDWLRKRWKKRPHQTVLQTWHGTMLKKIANDRPGQGLRARVASILESRRWDVMLAQNEHSTRILRRAYGFRGPVWEVGYPRDDVLALPDGAEIRARLGIDADTTIVLYAPTWRDDRLEHIDHLDVAAFTDALGPGHVTLIRGHSRTLRPGRDVRASNVIDVTGYPDVADLFLIADVLITDYSSVMFDFSVTGKPIFFYTPDLEHYGEQLRGFYFDLLEVAPGPVVQRADELVDLVRNRDAAAADYAARYAAWRERFNPHDDGHAAERVIERLVARGAIRP